MTTVCRGEAAADSQYNRLLCREPLLEFRMGPGVELMVPGSVLACPGAWQVETVAVTERIVPDRRTRY